MGKETIKIIKFLETRDQPAEQNTKPRMAQACDQLETKKEATQAAPTSHAPST